MAIHAGKIATLNRYRKKIGEEIVLNVPVIHGQQTKKASVIPTELQCEYLEAPLGLDVLQPRLSWKLKAIDGNKRGQKQTAYQILVAGAEDLLCSDKADLWDSGQVKSGESVNLVYQGKALQSGQVCFWRLRVADESGVWSDWSAPAYWTMGLFSGDWRAKWIGTNDISKTGIYKEAVDNNMPDPWFRKAFMLPESPGRAVVYVASVGYHELYVNGQKAGDDVLSPSVTNHTSRARYVTYDITKHLTQGNNVIALWLGVSWSVFPAYQTDDKPAAPIVSAQMDISFSGGTTMQIITDRTWKTHASPNMLLGYWDAHHFGGEMYDARLEICGWNDVRFDDAQWDPVSVIEPELVISAEKIEPNRLVKEINPVSVDEVNPGVYRIDMGVNYAGWFEMDVTGTLGDTVMFEFSERKEAASTYGLRSKYIIGSSGKGVFRNRFNYMSGRWVQVAGLNEKPALTQIKGWLIRPDFKRAGAFECDNSLLNKIYDTTLWTFENLSLGGYVVDCPQRERRGYGGDALATTRTGLNNYQSGAFYSKWMEDWRDVQGTDGNVSYTAPTYLGGGGPSWSGFCVTLPWEIYKQYGDKRILEESFPAIRRWLDFLDTKSENDMLVRWGGKWSFLGDWLWPDAWTERSKMEKQGKALGDTRETLFFNNCVWIYNLDMATDIAGVLGNEKDSEKFRKRADAVRKAVHDTFFNIKDNSYVNGYQGYMAIALQVNLPPEELRPAVWKRLEDEILIHRDGHIWAGITAGSFLLNTLLDNKRNDLIYAMATKEDFPGWGYMLKQNTGTFYEDWECRGSALHSSVLYIGSWFTEGLGGIQRPKAGYKHFVIEPWINKTTGPRKVRSHYDSLYGRIAVDWIVTGDYVNMEVAVPPNTEATLCLHEVDSRSIKESGKPVSEVTGISKKSVKENEINLQLVPGNYRFTVILK
jgi:alpha-L-rhamnosidase